MSTIPQPYPVAHVPDEGPVGVRRWRVYDSTEDFAILGYEFHLNPSRMTPLNPERALTVSHSVAPEGQYLIWEGAKQATQWSFGGNILHRDHFEAMQWWFDIKPLTRLVIFDHYGREISFVPQSFKPTPPEGGRRRHYWRHGYEVSGFVLDYFPKVVRTA